MFFTGTRAEYGLLRSLMFALQDKTDVTVSALVSGTHLNSQHGKTVEEIHQDGFCIAATADLELSTCASESQMGVCASMGVAMQKISIALYELKPDILVILGDRYEAFCCATAATMLSIPIVHLHGGEQTLGAVDEAFRHAITKMSHIHFASCEKHRQRIIQLGEDPERVWNTGALGVENALNMDLLTETEIRDYLGLTSNQPYLLCTFHPVTLEPGQELQQWQEVQKALDVFSDYAIIITGANADSGGNTINALLAEWEESNSHRVCFFASLGVLRYLSAAKYARCVVGNSSSGIIEIPSLKTPVVNIGNRQKGRMCSEAVLHCNTQATAIECALKKALSLEHKKLAQSASNPYGGENVAQTMSSIIASIPLEGLIKKKFYDLENNLCS